MMTAVWVAVLAAVAFWILVASAAAFLMVRTARLVSVTIAAVSAARERAESLAEQASAVTRQASEQVAKAGSITASMDEVAATMAELNGRLNALAPAAKTVADGVGVPLARAAALVYGVSRAVGLRRGDRAAVAGRERLAAGRRSTRHAGKGLPARTLAAAVAVAAPRQSPRDLARRRREATPAPRRGSGAQQ
ncbi:MAG TPA: hypothetical protein VGS19_25830 [Streptosporangiaceae bacterium]|nr:hypothetical protein [Streptosporangiaceae bacterium]